MLCLYLKTDNKPLIWVEAPQVSLDLLPSFLRKRPEFVEGLRRLLMMWTAVQLTERLDTHTIIFEFYLEFRLISAHDEVLQYVSNLWDAVCCFCDFSKLLLSPQHYTPTPYIWLLYCCAKHVIIYVYTSYTVHKLAYTFDVTVCVRVPKMWVLHVSSKAFNMVQLD